MKLTSNWHKGRIFRTLIGLLGVGLGVLWQDSLMGLAGGVLLFIGITDIGSKRKSD